MVSNQSTTHQKSYPDIVTTADARRKRAEIEGKMYGEAVPAKSPEKGKGEVEPQVARSLRMSVDEAFVHLMSLEDEATINEFLEGETRETVLREAKEVIESLNG